MNDMTARADALGNPASTPSDAELLWEARGLIETAAELAWNTNCDVEEAQFRDFLERTRIVHASDCATHNMPAEPNGPCDCSPVVKPSAITPSSTDGEDGGTT